MPGKKSRKFIDKKLDIVHTFKLVQRSQQDPLIADETAPQTVLLDNDQNESEKLPKYGVYFDDNYDYLQHLRGTKESINWDNAELEVYTIRKKDPKASSKKVRNAHLQLPSSVFESYMEEPIGLLNKAAPVTGPQPDVDPDIIAGLEDDFENCDEGDLPDNFVEMLNSNEPLQQLEDDTPGGVQEWLCSEGMDSMEYDHEEHFEGEEFDNFDCSGVEIVCEKVGDDKECTDESDDDGDVDLQGGCFNVTDSEEDDEGRDEVGSLNGMNMAKTFGAEETKSCFTNYSMTSSIIPRSEQLSLLDDRYEEKFLKEYADDQVGALDCEDIDGFVGEDSQLFKQAMKDSKKELSCLEDETRVKQWVKQQLMANRLNKTDMEHITMTEHHEPGEQWDCESILSTYSNIYNHPKSIRTHDVCPSSRKITIDPLTGLPVRRKSKYLSKKNLQDLDGDSGESDAMDDMSVLRSIVSTLSMRPKDESPEERRMRKAANKEYRRLRREEKKANQLQFKEEKKKQQKRMVHEAGRKGCVNF